MKAIPHPEQSRRLLALADHEILDTPPEKPFEDVVDLLTALCDTPIALVSLVDEDRQWFKARRGLDVPQTPIGQSICAHTILGDEILEIEDTWEDTRTADNPLCQGPDAMRFYAGAPLTGQDGLPMGSLCVIDRRPRRLTAVQRQALRVLADQVMAQIRLRQALRKEDTMRREVDHRVRNSLQLLQAINRREARDAASPETREVMERLGRRIASVANVHEQLYRSAAGHIVALDNYLESLARDLSSLAPHGVTVGGSVEPLGISWREATMLGTLFNETVSNAFKYAFPDGRPGRVVYAAQALGDGRLRFVCEDDGIGYGDADISNGTGLGTVLNEVIGMELEGTIEIELLQPGTRVALEFRPAELSRLPRP